LNRNRTVSGFFGGDVVKRAGAERVLNEMALAVVHADRPEAIDGYVFDRELVDAAAVVLGLRDIQVNKRDR
jgi:hypothetical protein